MDIEYLNILLDYPYNPDPAPGPTSHIRGIPVEIDPAHPEIESIEKLEQIYNNGQPFPKALRELLYLGGDYCYAFGKAAFSSWERMNIWCRKDMTISFQAFTRPIFIFHYNGRENSFKFVYLDEGLPNPIVYQGFPDYTADHGDGFIIPTNGNISENIQLIIDILKDGDNPF